MIQDLGSLIGFWRVFKEAASFFQNLFSGPNVLVEIGEVPDSPEEALKWSLLDFSFVVKIKNFENHSIKLSSWGLYVTELKGIFPPVVVKDPVPLSFEQYEYGLPHKLPARDSFELTEPLITVHKHMWSRKFTGVVDVVGYFSDSLDRVYYSSPYPFIIPSRKISF